MCGIAGLLEFSVLPVSQSRQLILSMLASLRHRGPDDENFVLLPQGAFGHQRLSIIDFANGQQPFKHPHKSYLLTFNGEIYNYRSLREQLRFKGVEFKTNSDTEVLLMLYDVYGKEMFQYIEGMYAFALWDGHQNELILARDPMGKKPLYYSIDDNGILFASELKAILQIKPACRFRLDQDAIQSYLALQYIPEPMTPFEGILKLPHGHYLSLNLDTRQQTITPTWSPESTILSDLEQNQHLTLKKALFQFDEQIQRAVELRVKAADVPVGVFLSGGIDSSLVTALAKQHTDYPLHTYCVGYRYSRHNEDERHFARHVSELLGTVHHEVLIGCEMLEQLPQLLWHLDEPLSDQALISTFALSKMAGADLKVVLTGQGGDEIFGGYHKYYRYKILESLRQLPIPVKNGLVSLIKRYGLAAFGWNRYQLLIQGITQQDALSIWQTYANFPTGERQKLLRKIGPIDDHIFRKAYPNEYDSFLQMQWDDLHNWLPYNLLIGLDKVTMAYGLEARAPFLDHHLACWAIGLPERLKWRKPQNKFLLREYAKQFLPAQVVNRPKKSFALPIDEWLFKHLAHWEDVILESPLIQETDLFNTDYIRELFQQYRQSNLRSIQPLWNLLVLKTWYDVYLPSQSVTEDTTLEMATCALS